MNKKNPMIDVDLEGFQILSYIGAGAAGDVYLARAVSTTGLYRRGELYAIKIYRDAILKEPKQLDRIAQEASVSQRIKSDLVVKVYEFRKTQRHISILQPDHPYLVMEFVDGLLLSQFVEMYHPLS